MKWIEPQDRLPKNNELVLIRSPRYYPSSAFFLKTTNHENVTSFMWMDAHDSNKEYYDVTHWMDINDLDVVE